jgi:hypothetical protein
MEALPPSQQHLASMVSLENQIRALEAIITKTADGISAPVEDKELSDEYMQLELKAIRGDGAAQDMLNRVAAAVGTNPTQARRIAAWRRLRKEEDDEPPHRAPRNIARDRGGLAR